MNSIMQIQIRTRGRITLPKVWRVANHIEAGDLINLTELENGVILLHAQPSKADFTLPSLLEELRQLRK